MPALRQLSFFRSFTTGHWRSYRSNDVAGVLKNASSEPVSITVAAIVRTIRKQKKHAFAKLGDGSTTKELQVLLSPAMSEGLATGTSVKISGTLKACPPGMQQSHELIADEVTILGKSNPETYPIQKKHHTNEFLRTLPHLRLRTPQNGLLTRLRSELEWICAEWFHSNGFLRVHPPVITSTDCEGGGEAFTLKPASEITPSEPFFKSLKFLTVSSQLHLEAYVHAHQAVWSLGPVFRAEKSLTPRHLSEFYMLEIETQTDSLSDVMDIAEHLLRHIMSRLTASTLLEEILSHHKNISVHSTSYMTTAALLFRWQALLDPKPWPRITYKHAISQLQAAHLRNPQLFEKPVAWDQGLSLEHEKWITATIGRGVTPVFVTDYPTIIKPFYVLPSDSQHGYKTSSSFDLLVPEWAELIGGSMRETNTDVLRQNMSKAGISNMDWYLDVSEHGSFPHGGFGLGFDRLLCYLAGEQNIREVVAWPRWVGRCDG